MAKHRRRNIGSVAFDCPNCGREYSRTLWEELEEDGFGGTVASDGVSCKCGAVLFCADDYENVNVYWLNKREMQQRAFLGQKPKIRPAEGLYYDLVRVPHGHVPACKVFLWGRLPITVREFRGETYFKCPECGAPSFFKINYQCSVCDDGYGWFRSRFRRRERRDYFRGLLKSLEVLILPLLVVLGRAWYVRSERRHWKKDGYGRVY